MRRRQIALLQLEEAQAAEESSPEPQPQPTSRGTCSKCGKVVGNARHSVDQSVQQIDTENQGFSTLGRSSDFLARRHVLSHFEINPLGLVVREQGAAPRRSPNLNVSLGCGCTCPRMTCPRERCHSS